VLAVLILALSGCSLTGPGKYAGRLYLDTTQKPCGHESAGVEILQQPPEYPFTRVAYVEAYAAFYDDKEVEWDELRNLICDQAAASGANAIIDMKVTGRPYSRLVEVLSLEVSTGGNSKKLTGIAIRYDDPSSDEAVGTVKHGFGKIAEELEQEFRAPKE